MTSYGVAFTSDGSAALAYSAQVGELWKIDTQTGERQKTLALSKRGRLAGFLPTGELLLVRHGGLTLIDATGWKRVTRIAGKKIAPELTDLGDGVIAGERIAVGCATGICIMEATRNR